MKEKKTGFYVFCALIAVLIAFGIWAVASVYQNSENPEKVPRTLELDVVEADVPPARQILEPSFHPSSVAVKPSQMDNTLEMDTLEEGATPTQDVGERGSLEGAIVTDYPMVYADSKYERLPDSPLFVFTDDMIWKDGEDGFRAKKYALSDQAKHIQEASIALSVSPRVEMGKTTGYRLVEIPEKTLFSKMGMVSGDIIVSINGTTPDMEPMALMFVNMAAGKQGQSTSVVDHRGVERTIHLRAAQ